ncbi:2'-5' RNA ligase family protein [Kutzneria kofuensis]|uniref:2'-5' RNA ligase superfamily protein n=1 Tax=Kutzneria kofuensis TaxID=103725 RepID=A0A7W9KM38_9PSEU|nr:2'-5' RNA ligase family protein [Kutzneria kofuensis]MBB5895079.1 hypothetical protein [Kutzneria kofuensis]
MPQPGQSALIIPVPTAAPLLARVAARYPDVVRPGDTGHVTMLYPFTDVAPAELAAVADDIEPVDVVLDRVVREPGFVALTADALGPLTAKIRGHWPEVVPYGGRFGPTPPAHLTLAMGVAEEEAADIATMATPVSARLTELWLLRYDTEWRVTGRHAFRGGR